MSFTDYYNELKDDPNNISYWFPKVKDCGIRVPKTVIMDVPEEIVSAFFMEGNQQEEMDKVYKWVKEDVIPILPKSLASLGRGLIFMKNGCFSNKFDFGNCSVHVNPLEIAKNLIDMNYTSFMFGTGGNTELVIREYIPFTEDITPCIYHGMPLRNEFRVFYDFDKKKALYVVNYWDWDYCHEAISRNITDQIVYEAEYPKLLKDYENNKNRVLKHVEKYMQNVDGLTGIWSVDILEDEKADLWLIDMAIGQQSAYWNPELAKGD